MLLLDAAQELHRSSSGGEDALEPSTAGSPAGEDPVLPSRLCSVLTYRPLTFLVLLATAAVPLPHASCGAISLSQPGLKSPGRHLMVPVICAGKDAQRDDARSRKPGLRAAPPKSRKVQEEEDPEHWLAGWGAVRHNAHVPQHASPHKTASVLETHVQGGNVPAGRTEGARASLRQVLCARPSLPALVQMSSSRPRPSMRTGSAGLHAAWLPRPGALMQLACICTG